MISIIKQKKFFELYFSMICLIGFSYQTYYLLEEYMSGKTVVNIQTGTKLDGIPAITIMMGSISLDKFAGYSNEFGDLYKSYMNFTKLSQNQPSYKLPARDVYLKAFEEVRNLIDNDKLNVGELFFNYTPDCRTSDNRPRIDARLSSGTDLKLRGSNTVKFNKHYRLTSDPDASLIYEDRLWKCFTIFSEIHRSWANVSANFTQIILDIEFDTNSSPHMYYPFGILFHSPNDLPLTERGTVVVFRSSTYYLAQYNQIRIERLGHKYDTDCFEYGIGKQFITMNDCLLKCHQDKHNRICDDKSRMVRSTFLVREEVAKLNSERFLSNCENYEMSKHEISLTCSKECKQPCTYSYYPVNLHKIGDLDFVHSKLMAEHNEMPDILIKYYPETSFISFFGNAGGLLGMWLGLSFLSMAQDIKQIISKFMTFQTVVKIKQNNLSSFMHNHNRITLKFRR